MILNRPTTLNMSTSPLKHNILVFWSFKIIGTICSSPFSWIHQNLLQWLFWRTIWSICIEYNLESLEYNVKRNGPSVMKNMSNCVTYKYCLLSFLSLQTHTHTWPAHTHIHAENLSLWKMEKWSNFLLSHEAFSSP